MLSQFCGAVTGWMLPRRARISAMPTTLRRRPGAIGGSGQGIGTAILLLFCVLAWVGRRQLRKNWMLRRC